MRGRNPSELVRLVCRGPEVQRAVIKHIGEQENGIDLQIVDEVTFIIERKSAVVFEKLIESGLCRVGEVRAEDLFKRTA